MTALSLSTMCVSAMAAMLAMLPLLVSVHGQGHHAIFVDYDSSYSVNLTSIFVGSVPRLVPTSSDYIDSAAYSTDRPGAVHLSLRRLNLGASTTGREAITTFDFIVPAGATLNAITAACDKQPTLQHFISYPAPSFPHQCDYTLSWSAPFAGQLQVVYNTSGTPPPGHALNGVNVAGASLDSKLTIAISSVPSVSTAQSSTGAASAFGDPRFVGFHGQEFHVAGMAGRVYNLINDAHALLNALFVHLDHIRCPLTDDGSPVDRCIDQPGTYFGALAIVTAQGDQVRITAGVVSEGFECVDLNGQRLLDSYMATSSITVRLLSPRSLSMHVGIYELLVENMDLYVDLASVTVASWSRLVNDVRPEGLLGRTWLESIGEPAEEGEVEQYRELDDDILGCNAARVRFHCTCKVRVMGS